MLDEKKSEKESWRDKHWTEWNNEDIENFINYSLAHPPKELSELEELEQDAEDGYFYDD